MMRALRTLGFNPETTTDIVAKPPLELSVLSHVSGFSGGFGVYGGAAMATKIKRRSVNRGTRFDVFRRDGFTCRYCGQRPPGVVLELDHIHPIKKGGTNDPLNLITSCYDCNRGKAAKVITDKAPKPDADLLFLETQQEIAEMRRYQKALAERDATLTSVVGSLQDLWNKESGLDWMPAEHTLRRLLRMYSIDMIGPALVDVAGKVSGGYITDEGNQWLRYLYAVCRNMAKSEEATNGAHPVD